MDIYWNVCSWNINICLNSKTETPDTPFTWLSKIDTSLKLNPLNTTLTQAIYSKAHLDDLTLGSDQR